MSDSSAPLGARAAWLQGLRDGAPFVLIVAPFAVVFGVVASEAGLSLIHTMGFSLAVLAGAAQLTAVQMIAENSPLVIILVTATAVNLRMAMYSASLAPHLGRAPLWQRAVVAYLMVDQAYAQSILRYDAHPEMSVPAKVGYYMGVVSLIAPIWYIATFVGAVAGSAIPESIPISLAVPIAFLSLVGPMLRTLPHVIAALVSVVGTISLSFVPYNMGLLIAGVLAMLTGAAVETALLKWRAKT